MDGRNLETYLQQQTRKRMAIPVTEKRLQASLEKVAKIIAAGHHQYLPIFLRLEKELASCKRKNNAIERAKLIGGG